MESSPRIHSSSTGDTMSSLVNTIDSFLDDEEPCASFHDARLISLNIATGEGNSYQSGNCVSATQTPQNEGIASALGAGVYGSTVYSSGSSNRTKVCSMALLLGSRVTVRSWTQGHRLLRLCPSECHRARQHGICTSPIGTRSRTALPRAVLSSGPINPCPTSRRKTTRCLKVVCLGPVWSAIVQ